MATFNTYLFSTAIVVRIKFSGKSLRKCAKDIGISASTLSRIQNGKVPDIETYNKVCVWLHLSMSFFFDNNIKINNT